MGETMSNIVSFKKPPPKEFNNLLEVLRLNYENHCPGISIFSPIRMIGVDNWQEILGYHRGIFTARLETTIIAIETYLEQTSDMDKESVLYDEIESFNTQYENGSPILTVALTTNEQIWTMTFVWNQTMYLITDLYRNEKSMNQDTLAVTMEKYNLTTESFRPQG